MATKTYTISRQKHAHGFELYWNHCKNTMSAMESGEVPMDADRHFKIDTMLSSPLFNEIMDEVYGGSDYRALHLSGPAFGLMKKIISWARGSRLTAYVQAHPERSF